MARKAKNKPVPVRLVIPHDPEQLYHEWLIGGRVKADRLGRVNERMYDTRWTLATCNNPDCPATGYISDAAVNELLDA